MVQIYSFIYNLYKFLIKFSFLIFLILREGFWEFAWLGLIVLGLV